MDGAKGGRPLLERYDRYLLISRHEPEVADRWFARHGGGTAFFSRLVPVARTFVSLPARVARMNMARFSLFTLLDSYPYSLALACGEYKLGEQLRQAMRPFDIPILIVAVALVEWYV